jgi:hypothetical protein
VPKCGERGLSQLELTEPLGNEETRHDIRFLCSMNRNV